MNFTPIAILALLLTSAPLFGAEKASPAKAPRSRYSIRTKSAVLGIRGLDEEDLKSAGPDERALEDLEQFASTPASIESFAYFKGLKLNPIAGGSPLKLSAGDELDEATFGKNIAATLLGAAPLARSKKVQRYINDVGTWLALRSDRPALKWRFAVLETNAINAFAVPGGYVFITQGLYEKLHSESELAAVLGHEITHIVARDHYNLLVLARTMASAQSVAKQMMARLPAFKAISSLSLDHAASVFSFALDKSAELTADQTGMMLAADAGYEPFGLPRVLQLLSLTRRDDPKMSLLFKTHPTPADRLRATETLRTGRLAEKASNPDMKTRFEEYVLY